MNGNQLSIKDYQIYLYKVFVLLSLAWAGFGLAISGFFHAWIAWLVTSILGVAVLALAKKHRVILKISREMFLVCLFSIIISLIFAFLSSPTVFSGRDQGAISEAAIRLSQNHSFYFSTAGSEEFFKLHEKGRALNFPGFYYTEQGKLVTQFPLVYITWLALFFSFFGLKGLAIANAVLLSIFFISFYLLLRLFIKSSSAMPAVAFTLTSFVFMWFTKFTLSENMALPLLWISILSLMLFIQQQRKLFYIVLLLSSILLSFTRIEGYAFLLIVLIIVFSLSDTRNYIKEKFITRFLVPLTFFMTVFVINFLIDINFYKEMAKAMLPSIKLPQAQLLGNLKNTALPDFYIFKLFALYGMIGFFILALIAVLIYIFKRNFYKLIPLFVVAPTLMYLFDSNISPDHPWMLRRYMFSLFPLAIFYSSLLIGEWLESKNADAKKMKMAAIFSTLLLVLLNWPAFSNFLNFKENEGLLTQVQDLSKRFNANDLILVDQKATSDGWSMITGPMSFLYGKNAVYFFNTQDLSKLDLSPFEKVYLISPNEQAPYYLSSTIGKRLIEDSTYSFEFKKLIVKRAEHLDKVEFPKKKDMRVEGKVFEIK